MTTILKSTRLSQNKKTEYQIEYTATGSKDEYRLRGGSVGTWTRWFPTKNIMKLLTETGFHTNSARRAVPDATLLEDFYVETHFRRSTIRLNRGIVLELANGSGLNAVCRRLYSRAKQTDFDVWIMPTSAIVAKEDFDYLYKVIKKNQ